MDEILKIAVPELGQKEIKGPKHNQTIVNYAREAGFTWISDDETPWCSIFINWVAKKAGLETSDKLNARSWLLVGQVVDKSPEPGDLVIFWRDNRESWKGHVGIFLGYSRNGKRVYSLGGNQGNQVSVAGYPLDNVLGFRRLSSSIGINLPDKILKKEDKGDDVKSLQNALKLAGIKCGSSDGIFGPATEKAVKTLQSMKTNLKVDGVYGTLTRNFLLEILNQ